MSIYNCLPTILHELFTNHFACTAMTDSRDLIKFHNTADQNL